MREKVLEAVFIILALVFVAGGYGIPTMGTTGFHAVPIRPEDLRVVSWNVGGVDGYAGRSLTDEYLPHIAGVLKKLNADLILLQEIASIDQVRELSRRLGAQWEAVASVGGRQLAIMGQRGRLQSQAGLEHGYRALTATYRSPGMPPVLVMNIHADPFSATERNTLIGRTVDVLMSWNVGYLKILAGDLNLDVDIDKRRDLFSDNDHLDVETYNYLIQRLADVTRNTGSTAEPDRRLDYIFAETGRLEVIRSGPWKGQRVADMDHDPVVADLRVKESPR